MDERPFTETPDLGVYSSRRVVEDREPIRLVVHEEDGDWQFLAGGERRPDEIRYVHVSHVIEWEPAVRQLVDLPLGWIAWRERPEDDWIREPAPADEPGIE